MLQITNRAATILKEERAHRGLPDHFGLRVKRAAEEDTRGGIRFAFTDAPAMDDAVTESEGLRVFVASDVVEELDELAIDTDEGAGRSDLILRDQGGTAP